MSSKITDEQKLEVVNALAMFKLTKLTKRLKQIEAEIQSATHYYEKKKLEQQLNYTSEKRDQAADLLTLTFD